MKAISWFKVNHMQANPEKMILHRLPMPCSITIDIEDSSIVPCEFIKLLGIYIDDKLSFEYHITNLCKKVAKQLNALSRISNNLKADSKMKIINAFTFSNFNYCSLIYHFRNKRNELKNWKNYKRGHCVLLLMIMILNILSYLKKLIYQHFM
jgi:hypothetical protein